MADAKKWIKVSDEEKRILSMSEEESHEYFKKSVAEVEANSWGSEERLAYYRSHGLDDCLDYPGGDVAFVRDVLAGDQREEHRPFTFELKQEDAYICKCLKDGRFRADLDFRSHFYMHPKVVLALEDFYTHVLGYTIQGPPPDYSEKIMSPDSDWYNEKDKPPVVEAYCPYPTFPDEP